MKRISLIACALFFFTGCSSSVFLQGNLFLDVWEENASEFFWGSSDRLEQENIKTNFSMWAADFEKTRDMFVRTDEDGVLQGSTIILAKTLEGKRKEYQASLLKLETIFQLQSEIKEQTGEICKHQKSSVSCDL